MNSCANPKFRRATLVLGLLSCVILDSAYAGSVTVLTEMDYEDGVMNKNGWSTGVLSGGVLEVSRDRTQNYQGSAGSLKATYPAPGDGANFAWAAFSVEYLNTRELYIEFAAKLPSEKQGLKFLKIFGGTGSWAANTTFGLRYGDGAMAQVSFGDGSVLNNDTACVINLDGTYPDWIGRSFGRAVVRTPQRKEFTATEWGSSWHNFKFKVKFNSGTSPETEVADGEYYVEIDGKVYVDAKGLLNRHYLNKPIESVQLLGWSQQGTQPFQIMYDNVRISTGGFASASAPLPPSLSVN